VYVYLFQSLKMSISSYSVDTDTRLQPTVDIYLRERVPSDGVRTSGSGADSSDIGTADLPRSWSAKSEDGT